MRDVGTLSASSRYRFQKTISVPWPNQHSSATTDMMAMSIMGLPSALGSAAGGVAPKLVAGSSEACRAGSPPADGSRVNRSRSAPGTNSAAPTSRLRP